MNDEQHNNGIEKILSLIWIKKNENNRKNFATASWSDDDWSDDDWSAKSNIGTFDYVSKITTVLFQSDSTKDLIFFKLE